MRRKRVFGLSSGLGGADAGVRERVGRAWTLWRHSNASLRWKVAARPVSPLLGGGVAWLMHLLRGQLPSRRTAIPSYKSRHSRPGFPESVKFGVSPSW